MSLSNNSTFNHNLKGPNERANLASSHREEIGIPPLGKSIKSVKAHIYLDKNHQTLFAKTTAPLKSSLLDPH